MARGNGEKGGRGGRSHGQGQSREVQISKALSLLLRHAAEKEGLKMNAQGYANVAEVLQWRKLKSIKATFDEIRHAVDTSDKKRFALLYIPSSEVAGSEGSPMAAPNFDTGAVREPVSTEEQSSATAQALAVPDTDPSHFLIRATQGHSMKSVDASSFLEPLSLNDTQLPDTVVHGTFYGAWQAILQSGGLQCMGRHHVHFATGPSVESVLASVEAQKGGAKESSEKTVISGMRWDAQVLIYIDLRKALQAGCPFWRSENGVILSEGLSLPQADDADGTPAKVVPVEFFDVVVERKAGLGKLWEKGKVLQELPTHLVNKGTPKQRK